MSKFAVGDRVAFSAGFLASTYADKEIRKMRGTVVEIKRDAKSRYPDLLKILWDGETDPRGSLASNIRKV